MLHNICMKNDHFPQLFFYRSLYSCLSLISTYRWCYTDTDFHVRSIRVHAHQWYEYEFCIWLSAYNCVSYSEMLNMPIHVPESCSAELPTLFLFWIRACFFVLIFQHCVIYLEYIVLQGLLIGCVRSNRLCTDSTF